MLEDGDMTSEDAKMFFAKLGADDVSGLEIRPAISQKASKLLFAPPVLYRVDHKVFSLYLQCSAEASTFGDSLTSPIWVQKLWPLLGATQF